MRGGGGWGQELEMRGNICFHVIRMLLLQVVQQGGGGGQQDCLGTCLGSGSGGRKGKLTVKPILNMVYEEIS